MKTQSFKMDVARVVSWLRMGLCARVRGVFAGSLCSWMYVYVCVYVDTFATYTHLARFIGKAVNICLGVSVNLKYKFKGKPGTTTVKHDFNHLGLKFHRGSPWVSVLSWLNLKANKDYFSYEYVNSVTYSYVNSLYVKATLFTYTLLTYEYVTYSYVNSVYVNSVTYSYVNSVLQCVAVSRSESQGVTVCCSGIYIHICAQIFEWDLRIYTHMYIWTLMWGIHIIFIRARKFISYIFMYACTSPVHQHPHIHVLFTRISTYFHIYPHISTYIHIYPHISTYAWLSTYSWYSCEEFILYIFMYGCTCWYTHIHVKNSYSCEEFILYIT